MADSLKQMQKTKQSTLVSKGVGVFAAEQTVQHCSLCVYPIMLLGSQPSEAPASKHVEVKWTTVWLTTAEQIYGALQDMADG